MNAHVNKNRSIAANYHSASSYIPHYALRFAREGRAYMAATEFDRPAIREYQGYWYVWETSGESIADTRSR